MSDTPKEPRTVSERSARSIHRSLVEFGYTDLTLDQVKDSAGRMLAGEDPVDIIDTFIRKMFVDAGLLS